MQRVALEVNHAETAFAHRLPKGGEADWALRWFTPVAEVRMCGHATLATAHVLRSTGAHEGPVRFATLSGVLVATPGEDGSLTLDFPTAPLTEVEIPAGVAGALGAEPRCAFDTGPDVGDLVVELADEKTVHALTPDHKALGAFSERGVIATSRPRTPPGATTSSRAASSRTSASTRTRSPAAPTRPSPPTGPHASAAPSSPVCRPRPAPAGSAPNCAVSAPCSAAARSPRSRANCWRSHTSCCRLQPYVRPSAASPPGRPAARIPRTPRCRAGNAPPPGGPPAPTGGTGTRRPRPSPCCR
jgi:hypothetical protein